MARPSFWNLVWYFNHLICNVFFFHGKSYQSHLFINLGSCRTAYQCYAWFIYWQEDLFVTLNGPVLAHLTFDVTGCHLWKLWFNHPYFHPYVSSLGSSWKTSHLLYVKVGRGSRLRDERWKLWRSCWILLSTTLQFQTVGSDTL